MGNLFRKNLPGFTATLLQISHEDLDAPLCLANNNEDLTYMGNVYKKASFEIELPEQDENSMGNARISLGVVDQQLIEIIRTISTPVTVSFIANYLEDGVFSYLDGGYDMLLKNVNWNATTLAGDLVLDSILNFNFPSGEFNPHNTNGIAS